MAPSEYDVTGDEKSINLEFDTYKNSKGESVHFKSKRGMNVRSPNRKIDWVIDPADLAKAELEKEQCRMDLAEAMKPTFLSLLTGTRLSNELKSKKPKKLSLWVKILMILGLMTVKKHNEESLYNKDSKDKSSNSTASN